MYRVHLQSKLGTLKSSAYLWNGVKKTFKENCNSLKHFSDLCSEKMVIFFENNNNFFYNPILGNYEFNFFYVAYCIP